MEGEGKSNVPSIIAAAHELKSPLGLIRQLALVLEDETISQTEREQAISRIYMTSQKALRLTSDLTRAYSLNDPTLFPLSPINPQQLCRDLIYDMTPQITAKNRQIKVLSPVKVPLVVANADLLNRILANFMDNALCYTFDQDKIELSINILRSQKKVRIGLRDFGPAIRPGHLSYLKKGLGVNLESIQARPESSGLGIYISSRFAEIINSKTGVIRHKNGATFYVEVPISTQLSLFEGV